MPAPIFNLPIHTIEQARALAGLLRAYIDDQTPSDNDGEDWKPDPEFEGICAIAAHLDAGIAGASETDAQYKARHAAARPAPTTVKVKVLRTIKSDLPRLTGSLLRVEPGIYDAESNPLGALFIRTPGGLLGIKPGEFERL